MKGSHSAFCMSDITRALVCSAVTAQEVGVGGQGGVQVWDGQIFQDHSGQGLRFCKGHASDLPSFIQSCEVKYSCRHGGLQCVDKVTNTLH